MYYYKNKHEEMINSKSFVRNVHNPLLLANVARNFHKATYPILYIPN